MRGLPELPQRFQHRQIRFPLAVGVDTLPPPDPHLVRRGQARHKEVDHRGLADPRLAAEHATLAPALPGPQPALPQPLHLPLPAHHGARLRPAAGAGPPAPAGTDTPAGPPFPDTAACRPYRLTRHEWREYSPAAPCPSPAARPTRAGIIPPLSPAGQSAAPGSGARSTPGAVWQWAAPPARDGFCSKSRRKGPKVKDRSAMIRPPLVATCHQKGAVFSMGRYTARESLQLCWPE